MATPKPLNFIFISMNFSDLSFKKFQEGTTRNANQSLFSLEQHDY
jgi:hypothetical protein